MSKYQIRYSNSAEAGPGFGNLLGDISAPNYEYFNATLDEQINCAGTLTFTLLPTNPALDDIALRTTTIMLYRDGEEIWRGRVIRVESDMLNRRTFTCEGVLAWLYDVMVKRSLNPNGSAPSSVVVALLTGYLATCSTNRRINWGTVEPTELWYGVEEGYYPIFDLFASLLENSGGYFRIRFSSFGSAPHLDYLNLPTAATGQGVTFGVNLFDVAKAIDVSNIFTRVRAEDTAGHSTVVYDTDLVNAFGVSETYVKFDRAFSSNTTLGVYARLWLKQNIFAESTTISVSALDLNLTDEEYNAFYVGQPVRIISPLHGIDTTMILTGLQTDISNPAASQLTLGAVPQRLTNYVASNSVSGSAGMTTDDISPSITQTAGNSTLTVTAAKKYGKVVQIGFYISVTGNVAEGENIWSGTLSDYLPVAYISTASYYGVATPSAGVFRITAAGDMNFRLVKGALSNGASLYCGLTYITEG